MKAYKIKKQKYDAHSYMQVIIDRETGEELAVYRLTPGCERAEITGMRRTLDRHLAQPGQCLNNYQW